MSISNRAEPNYASFDSNSVINMDNSDTEQPNTYSDKLRKNNQRQSEKSSNHRQLAILILTNPIHLVINREEIMKGRVRETQVVATLVMVNQERIYLNLDRDVNKIMMIITEFIRKLRI